MTLVSWLPARSVYPSRESRRNISMIQCARCGTYLPEGTQVCTTCGAQQPARSPNDQPTVVGPPPTMIGTPPGYPQGQQQPPSYGQQSGGFGQQPTQPYGQQSGGFGQQQGGFGQQPGG